MKKTKEKGITLIALVVTIIVLLILAGISILTLTGENGVLTRAEEAKEKDRMSKAKEIVELTIYASLDEKGNFNKEQFKKEIEQAGGIIVKEEEEKIIVKVDIYQAIINVEKAEIIKFGTESTISPNFSINTNINPNNDTIAPKKQIDITATSNTGVSFIKTPDGNLVEGNSTSYPVRANGDYKFVIIDSIGNEKDEVVSISGISNKLQLFPLPSGSNVSFELKSGVLGIDEGYATIGNTFGIPYIHLEPINDGKRRHYAYCCWKGIDFSNWKTLHVKFSHTTPPDYPYFLARKTGNTDSHLFERPSNGQWWTCSFNMSGSGWIDVELKAPEDSEVSAFSMDEVYMTE